MMLPSFLARRHPLLSRLRRHERHERRSLPVRRADEIPSRSYTSSEDESETTDSDVDHAEAKPVTPIHRRQHMYLVLDDWKKGFSIHKLDLNGSDGVDLTLRPPLHRQSSDLGEGRWTFAALGNNIIAAGKLSSSEKDCVTLVYDTETAGLSIIRDPALPKPSLDDHWLHAAAVHNGLYTFSYSNSMLNERHKGIMHRLEDTPATPRTCIDAHWWGTRDHWTWSSIPSPLPFHVFSMQSIAVHPDGGGEGGGSLFVSLSEWDRDSEPLGRDAPSRTYFYDIGSGRWRGHGECHLPFCGEAHYDSELDAWVGLHKSHGFLGHPSDGYICSCDVISPTEESPTQPAWKLCTTRLFDPHDPKKRRMKMRTNVNLVYMGDSTYCLVEVVPQEAFRSTRCTTTGNKCKVRLATFRLKYGKNGELITTMQGPDHYYLFSKYLEHFQVQAFWM